MTTRTGPRPTPLPAPPARVLARTYAATLLTHLPLLGVLLLPWGRSRFEGGSAALTGLVTLALTATVVTAVVYAPELCARVAPAAPDWLPGGRARRSVARLRRRDRRAHLLVLGESAVLYITAQGLGGVAGVIRPYVRDAPAPVVEAGGHPWEFHYAGFALQAVVLYLGICFATTWYACRLRGRVTGAPA